MPTNFIINIPNHKSICKSLKDLTLLDTNSKFLHLKNIFLAENESATIPGYLLFDIVKSLININTDFRLLINGNEIFNNDCLLFIQSFHFITLTVLYKLLGGKGGFGATLRGAKGRKKTSFNIDSCRDLQGRRIRQTRLAEQVKKWNEANLTKEQLETLKTSSSYPTSYPEPITNSKGYKVQFSLKERRKALVRKLDDSYIKKKKSVTKSVLDVDIIKSHIDDMKTDKYSYNIEDERIKSVESELNSLYGIGNDTFGSSYTANKVPHVNPLTDKCDKISLGAKLAAALIKN